MKEIWVDIKDFEGLYQVSNYGRVKSLERYTYNPRYGKQRIKEKILSVGINTMGRFFVYLYKNGVRHMYQVHRLVAEAFIPNPENKPIIHHKDHNYQNNNVENLVWLTNEEHSKEHPEWGSPTAKRNSKQINQYDLEGNFIRKWNSFREIERELGYYHANVSNCCQGKQITAYGYIWKYAEDC